MNMPLGVPNCVHCVEEGAVLIEDLDAVVARSPTNTRPRESIASVCGTLNSPGPAPRLPHALMNLPSFVNFTTRELLWPSATKMSPFVAERTSHGPLKCRGLAARRPWCRASSAACRRRCILKTC